MSGIEDSLLIDIEFQGDIKAAPNGDLQLIKGVSNLKQALFNRLVTVQGTLAHRPLYGVGVQKWQNGIGSVSKQQALAIAIKKQFEEDERVEKVTSIQIILDNEKPGQFLVKYKVLAVAIGDLEDTVNPFGDIIV